MVSNSDRVGFKKRKDETFYLFLICIGNCFGQLVKIPPKLHFDFCFSAVNSLSSNTDSSGDHSFYDGAMVNGAPASSSNATIQNITPALPSWLTLAPDGTFTIQQGQLPGRFDFTYQVCSGGVCSNPIYWGVTIQSPLWTTIDYVTYGTLGTLDGGGTYNVLSNDIRFDCDTNGQSPLLYSSLSSFNSSTMTPAYFSINNTNGNIVANSNALGGIGSIPVGDYVLTYMVCDATYPSICATQYVYITVSADVTPLAPTTPNPVVTTKTTTKTTADIVNIPDANLKNILITPNNGRVYNLTNTDYTNADIDGNFQIDTYEASLVGGLNISNSNISDLTGLEAFTNLTNLYAPYNNVSSYNLILPSLQRLSLASNPLPTLNTNNMNNLTMLFLYNTLINSLDFTNNLLLNNLGFSSNFVSSIDLGMCPNLTYLYIKDNVNLLSLNIKNTSSLDYASITSNNWCWTNCPNLTSICADDFEIPALQSYLANCGVSITGIDINSNCAMGVENAVANSFAIAPNPSSGVFTVTFGAATLPLAVEVYDVMGKKVYSNQVNSLQSQFAVTDNSFQLDLTNYPSGAYFVTIKTGNEMMKQTVIKK